MTVTAACLGFRVSRRTYYRWLPRWHAAGRGRPRRPQLPPAPQPAAGRRPTTEREVAQVREATGWGPDRIGALLGLAASTCHRVLDRLGYLERTRHRASPSCATRSPSPAAWSTSTPRSSGGSATVPGTVRPATAGGRKRGIGWEVLHVAVDAATRLVYAELLPDEKGRTTARFLVRAVRWFRARGIHVVRLLTDNGSPYRSRVFARARRLLGLRHSRTRPYRPADQRQGRALDPHGPVRVPLRRGLRLARRAPLALERFLGYYNGAAPAPRHRRTDSGGPAHRAQAA